MVISDWCAPAFGFLVTSHDSPAAAPGSSNAAKSSHHRRAHGPRPKPPRRGHGPFRLARRWTAGAIKKLGLQVEDIGNIQVKQPEEMSYRRKARQVSGRKLPRPARTSPQPWKNLCSEEFLAAGARRRPLHRCGSRRWRLQFLSQAKKRNRLHLARCPRRHEHARILAFRQRPRHAARRHHGLRRAGARRSDGIQAQSGAWQHRHRRRARSRRPGTQNRQKIRRARLHHARHRRARHARGDVRRLEICNGRHRRRRRQPRHGFRRSRPTPPVSVHPCAAA